MSPHIRRAAAQCLQAANHFMQLAFVAGAALLTAIESDFHYVPAVSVIDGVVLVLLVGFSPALLIAAWREQRRLEQVVVREGAHLLGLIVLSYAWPTGQIDLIVASTALIVQVSVMRFFARRSDSKSCD